MAWGEDEWFAALVADDDLYYRILRGIGAAATRADRRTYSPRVVLMLELSAQGLSRREIGARMGCSIDMVNNYRRQAFARLGVNTITKAVRLARQRGVIA